MADTPNDPAAAAQAQQQQGPQISIRAQLARSLTFTNPGALQKPEGTPSVTVNINVDAGKRDEENFMVGLRIEASSRTETQEFYSVSLDYAGVFNITNYEPQVLEPLLLIECPRILFPFARRIIADVTRDGGYAPLMLDPVDFVALYRRELSRRASEQGESNGAAAASEPAAS